MSILGLYRFFQIFFPEVPVLNLSKYRKLCMEAECQVVEGKPLATLWNAVKGFCSGFFRTDPQILSKAANNAVMETADLDISATCEDLGECCN
ncbi:hypothetical protein J5N97_013440 [Dioscorea zingiberensis]|uniref:Uncharacterized protein n=1 Tax=Dioscorea zingiberensis TaxID=325984 RepID=A0A9D5CQR1_9LILI|nr:hypothetical protein J5N97_013440 [Dioscorea zingiberensis]